VTEAVSPTHSRTHPQAVCTLHVILRRSATRFKTQQIFYLYKNKAGTEGFFSSVPAFFLG